MVKQEPNLEERIWKKDYPILKPTGILTLTGILKPTTGKNGFLKPTTGTGILKPTTGILRPNSEP